MVLIKIIKIGLIIGIVIGFLLSIPIVILIAKIKKDE